MKLYKLLLNLWQLIHLFHQLNIIKIYGLILLKVIYYIFLSHIILFYIIFFNIIFLNISLYLECSSILTTLGLIESHQFNSNLSTKTKTLTNNENTSQGISLAIQLEMKYRGLLSLLSMV